MLVSQAFVDTKSKSLDLIAEQILKVFEQSAGAP